MISDKQDKSLLHHLKLTVNLSWQFIVSGVILIVLFYYLLPALVFIPALYLIFILFFFRNPRRKVPSDTGVVLSPADGKILDIKNVYEDTFIKGVCVRITIFLSLYNVHINRAPVSGKVTYIHYRPGKFIPAFKSHASEINEKNFIGVQNGSKKILFTQVTGFIARRVVCWVKEGNSISGGDIIGAMKFGSCMEVFVPLDTSLVVKTGDCLRAGETILGRLNLDPEF